MANFLTRALMGLFLSKNAQAVLEKRAKANGRSAREQALAQVKAQSQSVMTDDRAALIRQAMQVRKAKQTVLADLSDTERQKLVAVAMKKLLNEGKPE
jgi:hypothetical protein